jgi:hypothetical protein
VWTETSRNPRCHLLKQKYLQGKGRYHHQSHPERYDTCIPKDARNPRPSWISLATWDIIHDRRRYSKMVKHALKAKANVTKRVLFNSWVQATWDNNATTKCCLTHCHNRWTCSAVRQNTLTLQDLSCYACSDTQWARMWANDTIAAGASFLCNKRLADIHRATKADKRKFVDTQVKAVSDAANLGRATELFKALQPFKLGTNKKMVTPLNRSA